MAPVQTTHLLRKLIATRYVLIVLILLSLGISIYFYWRGIQGNTYQLRMSAGSLHGRRTDIARALVEEANAPGIFIEIEGTQGSGEALQKVSEGRLDIALIQGGIETLPNVQQVAVLQREPLHVLVKPGLDSLGLNGLRGRRLNLSSPGSGSNLLSKEVLAFAGLSEETYTETNLSYSQIAQLPRDSSMSQLPDAFFMVSSLPSGQAEILVKEYGYRLMEIPFGAAFSNQRFAVKEYWIPAYTYGLVPSVPQKRLKTLGTQLILIAHKSTPRQAINQLLNVIYGGDFARKANLPSLDEDNFLGALEYPIHPGARMYRNRDNPAITSEFVEYVENFRSFVFSLIIASFFIWQWYARRKGLGIVRYLVELNQIELRVLNLEMHTDLEMGELIRMRNQLIKLKSEAIAHHSGQDFSIRGEESLTSFLNHATHTSNYIHQLMARARQKAPTPEGGRF